MSIEDIIISHAEWIRRKAGFYYSDPADADDLASETIYKCLSQGDCFDTSRDFKPWAHTIMENTYKVAYNRRKCVPFVGYDEAVGATGSMYSDQRAILRTMLSVIRGCMRKSCVIECVLLYAKGYDYSEISEKMRIPVGTVKSRISAGRKMLRNALAN